MKGSGQNISHVSSGPWGATWVCLGFSFSGGLLHVLFSADGFSLLSSPPSCQHGVVYLFIGVRLAGDFLQRAAVTLWQQVVTGRIQNGCHSLSEKEIMSYSRCKLAPFINDPGDSLWSDLHGFLSLAESQQVDDGVLALGPDTGVLVLGVVEQTLQQGLNEAVLHCGSSWVFEHPPQHPLRHQSDVTGLILKTLKSQKAKQVNCFWMDWIWPCEVKN